MTVLQLRAADLPRDTELFRGLDLSQINSILAQARVRRCPARSVMTYQAEPADHLLLLAKGRARYFFETCNGKKLILRWLTPGQVFGVAALVPSPSTYVVSTEAVRNSVAIVWDGQTIRALARQFPQLVANALLIGADYISWYAAAHASLTSESARERVAHVLLALANSVGVKVPGGIELDVTNEELANSAYISLYTISRVVSGWQRSGAVRKTRGKLLLRSIDKLFRDAAVIAVPQNVSSISATSN